MRERQSMQKGKRCIVHHQPVEYLLMDEKSGDIHNRHACKQCLSHLKESERVRSIADVTQQLQRCKQALSRGTAIDSVATLRRQLHQKADELFDEIISTNGAYHPNVNLRHELVMEADMINLYEDTQAIQKIDRLHTTIARWSEEHEAIQSRVGSLMAELAPQVERCMSALGLLTEKVRSWDATTAKFLREDDIEFEESMIDGELMELKLSVVLTEHLRTVKEQAAEIDRVRMQQEEIIRQLKEQIRQLRQSPGPSIRLLSINKSQSKVKTVDKEVGMITEQLHQTQQKLQNVLACQRQLERDSAQRQQQLRSKLKEKELMVLNLQTNHAMQAAEEQLNRKSAKIDELEKELQRLKVNVDELRQECQNLKRSLNEAEVKIATCLLTIEEKNNIIARSDPLIADLKRTLEQERHSKETTIAKLTQQLQQKTAAFHRLQQINTNLKQQTDKLQKERLDSNKTISRLLEQNKGFIAQLKQQQKQKKEQLRRAQIQVVNSNKYYQQQKKNNIRYITDANIKVKKVQKQMEAQAATIRQLVGKNSKLAAELAQRQEQIVRQQSHHRLQIDRLSDEIRTRADQTASLMVKIASLERSCAKSDETTISQGENARMKPIEEHQNISVTEATPIESISPDATKENSRPSAYVSHQTCRVPISIPAPKGNSELGIQVPKDAQMLRSIFPHPPKSNLTEDNRRVLAGILSPRNVEFDKARLVLSTHEPGSCRLKQLTRLLPEIQFALLLLFTQRQTIGWLCDMTHRQEGHLSALLFSFSSERVHSQLEISNDLHQDQGRCIFGEADLLIEADDHATVHLEGPKKRRSRFRIEGYELYELS